MSFQRATTFVAIVTCLLTFGLIFAPGPVYWLFGLDGNALGDFMVKRSGVLFAGYTVLCLVARRSESGEVQRLVSLTIAVPMGLMALLGLYELLRGMAGPGILVAVAIEAFFAVIFTQQYRQHRRLGR